MGKLGLFFHIKRSLMVNFLWHNCPSSNRRFSRIYAPVHGEATALQILHHFPCREGAHLEFNYYIRPDQESTPRERSEGLLNAIDTFTWHVQLTIIYQSSVRHLTLLPNSLQKLHVMFEDDLGFNRGWPQYSSPV